jgi:regulator of sigma E protease
MLESILAWLQTPLNWLLLGIGFGFVIFWHELGHFLAAKYVGIKVEQFAVGFGQAVLAWRKGMGLRVGTTTPEFEHRVKEHLARTHADEAQANKPTEWTGEQFNRAAAELGISETEYRLNWIPLGGYVKMLGQDDMKPGAEADDPRAYNRKSVGARMLVVSAGVIMNIILAAIGFMVVFLAGFEAPPTVVGQVLPGSPAQKAEIEPGDRILTLDGARQHEFTKIQLNSALADPKREIPVTFEKPDGSVRTKNILPTKAGTSDTDFPMLGVGPAYELRGPDPKKWNARAQASFDTMPDSAKLIRKGDVVTAINDEPVGVRDIAKFDAALQASHGKPVKLTVRRESGEVETIDVQPTFAKPFSIETPANLLGMEMLPRISRVGEDSAGFGKLKVDDVVVAVGDAHDRIANPSISQFQDFVRKASSDGRKIDVEVLRVGERLTVPDLDPNRKLETGGRGLNVGLDMAWDVPVVATPIAKSSADGVVLAGFRVSSVNGTPVTNWFEMLDALRAGKDGQPVSITGTLGAKATELKLSPTKDERKLIADMRFTHPGLAFGEYAEPRKTTNPFVAALWGVGETRDAVLQVYLTVKRMTQGSVSYKAVSGPVGIFAAGYKFADRGAVWLTWFLSIISANLAVMNFLPIPIVDGGLFTFLIIEKIKGKPVSPKVQSVAQVVGLAILLSVFLLATYQDISRL